MTFDQGKTSTRFREQNILNSAYAVYEANKEYGIPDLLPVKIDNLEDIPLQGFNYAKTESKPEKVGLHFFLHDYQFDRVWRCPDRYINMFRRFAFVLSPDFSPYADLPKAIRIFNIYRKNWCARYWQENGIVVIPTVTIGKEEDIDFCLAGIPQNSIIAISTAGEGRWGGCETLKRNWKTVIERLKPETVLLYGRDLSNELSGNIIYKPETHRRGVSNV